MKSSFPLTYYKYISGKRIFVLINISNNKWKWKIVELHKDYPEWNPVIEHDKCSNKGHCKVIIASLTKETEEIKLEKMTDQECQKYLTVIK